MHPLTRFLDSKLIQRSQLLQTLTHRARSRVSPTVAKHCWVAGIHSDVLVVLTDSSSWAVSIRYQQHEILKLLNSEFHMELEQTLKRLKIKVVSLPNGGKKTISKPRLSESSARLIATAAETIQDPELSIALKRLAQHGKVFR